MGKPLALIFQEEYITVPEIVEKFAQTYHIAIREPGSGKRKKDRVNTTYKTIYQHIKRDLDEAVDRGDGGDTAKIKAEAGKRGDLYARELVYQIVNNTSAKSLLYMADQAAQKEHERWRVQAQNVKQQYVEQREAGLFDPEQESPLTFIIKDNRIVKDKNWENAVAASQQGIETALREEFEKKKLEIMEDYIFRHLIDLNEELLKYDISAELTYDPTDDRDGEKLQALERLKNMQNYYSIRKKDKKEDGGQV